MTSILIQDYTDLNTRQISSTWNKNPICYLLKLMLFFSSCIFTIAAIWERRKVSSSSRAAIFLIAASLTGGSFSSGLLCFTTGDDGSQTSCKGWENKLFSSSSFFHMPFLWVEGRKKWGEKERGEGWRREGREENFPRGIDYFSQREINTPKQNQNSSLHPMRVSRLTEDKHILCNFVVSIHRTQCSL